MNDDHSRLSRIETMWSMVRVSQNRGESAAKSAQEQLLSRYENAIRRYLVACLKNSDAAEEVYQEFALKFIRGDFKCADSEHGRFRSFLKTTLYRLVVDHFRRKKRNAVAKLPDGEISDESPSSSESEDEFVSQWRTELLLRALEALERHEKESGQRFHTIMKLRTDHPKISSTELASMLGEKVGSEISPANARVLLHRAREKFAALLIEEVSQTLSTTSLDEAEQELADLNLLVHCREAIDRMRNG